MEEEINVSYWQGTQSEFEGLKNTDKLNGGRIYFAFGEDGYGTIYLGVSRNTYKEIGCGTQKEIEKIKARLTADEVAIDANATSIIRILEMLNKKADIADSLMKESYAFEYGYNHYQAKPNSFLTITYSFGAMSVVDLPVDAKIGDIVIIANAGVNTAELQNGSESQEIWTDYTGGKKPVLLCIKNDRKQDAPWDIIDFSTPRKTSDLENDSGFVTEEKLEDYLLKKDHIAYDDIIALFT